MNKEDLKKEEFAKFGFEVPSFECEILKEIEGRFIGYFKPENIAFPTSWTKEGIQQQHSPMFDLTPIKKPWYEDSNNFPKLMFDGSRRFLSQNQANYLYALELGHRLATNEEIDNLKCKG